MNNKNSTLSKFVLHHGFASFFKVVKVDGDLMKSIAAPSAVVLLPSQVVTASISLMSLR